MKAVIATVLLLGASVAFAQGRPTESRYDGDENISFAYADVLRVDPVYDRVETSEPSQECYDERVVTRERGGNTTGGTVLGAVIGGALGNQVGKGDGRKAATVAGAVIGGAIGHNAAKGGDRTYETTERRCRDVDNVRTDHRVVGYDVEYRFRGEVYNSRLNYDPGDRLRVRVSITPAE